MTEPAPPCTNVAAIDERLPRFMYRLTAWFAVVALIQTGCFAVRYPKVVGFEDLPPETFPVVGIVEPLAHLDAKQPLASVGELWTFDAEGDVREAAHLIELLRAAGLFKEGDFICQLKSAPNVALAAIARNRSRDALETTEVTMWYWALTFGLVPWITTDDYGTRFMVVGSSPQEVVLEHEETSVVGWGALFLDLSPNWHMNQNPEVRSLALSGVLQRLQPSIFDQRRWLSNEETGRLTRRCGGPSAARSNCCAGAAVG